MAARSNIKSFLISIVEVAKWGLVLWLLFPIRNALHERVDFVRVVLGILLFILFAGKLFYDTVLLNWQKTSERSKWSDILSMLGIVATIAVVIAAVVLFVGFLVFSYFQSATQE